VDAGKAAALKGGVAFDMALIEVSAALGTAIDFDATLPQQDDP